MLRRLPPEVVASHGASAYHAALDACAKAGRWRVAIELLESMEGKGLSPTTRAYNCAVAACGRAREGRRAVRLVEKMREEGVELDVISFGAAISACERSKHWQARPGFCVGGGRRRGRARVR